jgi:hypothetical protein
MILAGTAPAFACCGRKGDIRSLLSLRSGPETSGNIDAAEFKVMERPIADGEAGGALVDLPEIFHLTATKRVIAT